MTTSIKRRFAVLGVTAALITGAPLLAAAPSQAATKPMCRAYMSDATPKQYSNTYVKVRTASHAKVKTVAHYKTTNTGKKAKANHRGRASLKYYVSGSTSGYKVKVSVTVTKNGKSNYCSTSFKAHR